MADKIIDGIKYWAQLFLLPVYWLSFLMPRDKKIWLFGASFGNRFADNPKYLYLYCSQHKKELGIRPVWISRDKKIVTFLNQNGYEAYECRSLKGLWLALRGKVYLYDNYSKDINFWLSGGALKFNLWHGSGNKRINYDNRFDRVRHPRNLWERFKFFPRRLSDEKPTDYILATSPQMAEIFSSAFRVKKNHVIVDGYPRNDVLFEGHGIKMLYTDKEKKVVDQIKRFKQKGYRVIFYMPTFRESEKLFFRYMNLPVFHDFLKENHYVFYIKLHPKSKLQKEFSKIKYSNMIYLPSEIDTYTILGLADMLTTDYSSVHTDYLMLNRPSVLFLYDLEEYSINTRDCYFDYDSYMPEIRTYHMQEFMKGIQDAFSKDSCMEKRLKLREKMWKYTDFRSSERLVRKVKKLLNGK